MVWPTAAERRTDPREEVLRQATGDGALVEASDKLITEVGEQTSTDGVWD